MGTVYRLKGRNNWMMQDPFRDGRPIRESSGTDNKTAAKKLLRNRETDIDRGLPVTAKVGRVRFDEAAADLVNEYKVNNRRSLAELQRRITKHLQPFFGAKRMSTITAADVRSYVTHRQEALIVTGTGEAQVARQVSNAEINRELTALKRAFSLAVEGGKLLYRPHIPMLEENNVRTGFFERDQFRAVCAQLPPALQAVMRFAYVTGWRIDSEVLPLQWRQVDFNERLTPSQKLPGTVRLDAGTTKNNEGRVFPFTEELRDVLLAQHAEHERLQKVGHVEPWVFFRLVAKGRGGKLYPKPILRLNKAWKLACDAAGVPGRIPHDLRRTAVRNLVRAGISESVAMRLTGHKTRSVFKRYDIITDGDLGAAAERIDAADVVPAPAAKGRVVSMRKRPDGQRK